MTILFEVEGFMLKNYKVTGSRDDTGGAAFP